MPKTHDKHLKLLVLYPAKNAIVIYSITPEFAEVSFQALAELPGIFTPGYARIQKLKNPS
jgi:hypothetical protein